MYHSADADDRKRKETYEFFAFVSPTGLRETKIDNQGIDYQKVDTSAQIGQLDNNSNRDETCIHH
ncbi:hypothetical protein NQ318_001195 [Aromia moschata]|uniref:Uncharacterized protein n=1 Tax=Aromia moschata TaxID=1265417 RepID=A0AAV8ZHE3_9CUCU|nr:hypothetical protein NQ318_001195 [Aromia moschata]